MDLFAPSVDSRLCLFFVTLLVSRPKFSSTFLKSKFMHAVRPLNLFRQRYRNELCNINAVHGRTAGDCGSAGTSEFSDIDRV